MPYYASYDLFKTVTHPYDSLPSCCGIGYIVQPPRVGTTQPHLFYGSHTKLHNFWG